MGFCEVVTQPLNCVVNIQKFTKNLPGGIKDLAEWLRASVDTCRQISPSELAILKKLCTAGELEIPQHKTVFVIPLPSGFEHDASAQPNKQAWWLPPSPTGAEGDKFVHFGLRHWDHQRQAWQQQPLPQHKPLVLAPKLTTSQMNAFVDSLVSQREDLPSKMPLTDLFEALADVWESGN
ncbi:hypothetical protein BASA81_001124 [Batrachochytrium salamandrivorans]|nr:hypothetical protein BASA81_001124 [Batrachochytrium salamandrivorans]